MYSHPNHFTDQGLSRRQFGLLLSGGAFLLLAGGSYGVIGRTPPEATTAADTAFGSLAVLRAGRLARLDARGNPSFTTLAAGALRLDPETGAGRDTQIRRAGTLGRSSMGGHGNEALGNRSWPEPANLTWADVVLLELEIRNTGATPVLFSPGQLRLTVDRSTAVVPRDADRSPGPIAPHATERILISYLAPHSARELELAYSHAQQDRTYRLALPLAAAAEARS